ncbi:hypothetical protein ACWDFH_19325 [Streptomyces kronopolitis]
MSNLPMKRGPRFIYIYAERLPDDTEVREGDNYYVGKLITAHCEVADLVTQLLGARTSTGRRVHIVEVGKPEDGAALDVVHTLATTTVNTPEETS